MDRSRIAAAMVVGALVGCGSAADSGLFDGASSSSSGGPSDLGSGDAGTVVYDSAAAQDASAPRIDAGEAPDAVVADAIAADTGPADAPDPGIACGVQECNAQAEVCCYASSDSTFRCVAPGDCSDAPIACDDAYDCNASNKICCAYDFFSDVTSASCTSQGHCDGQSGTVLCSANDPTCPPGLTCAPHPSVPGLSSCQ